MKTTIFGSALLVTSLLLDALVERVRQLERARRLKELQERRRVLELERQRMRP